jgi:hypothetical protein
MTCSALAVIGLIALLVVAFFAIMTGLYYILAG